MSVVRKKQDDKYLKALRELVTTGSGNRQCFDCGQKGPTYVNMTIGSFVCTRCSGVLRGLTPPHRVKSISMATFTQDELDFLKAHGNDLCGKTWLGLWDPKRAVHQDHRELMIDKYERKRYYLEPASPLKSLTNAVSLKTNNSTSAQNNKNSSSSSSNDNNNPHITNGFGSDHNKPQQNAIDNSFQNIQFTTPTSQRTTANGLHKSSTSAISRPQHQQNGFNHHQQDAFMLNNSAALLNGLNASSAASTGALSDTSSCASHGFGPEGDFVADFGSANIFDATSAGSVGSPTVSSSASSVASSNGYAKIQSIKAAHQLMNGHANSKQHQLNGANSSSNGNTENFADFDHAPIFNAAANYQFIRKSNLRKKPTAISQQQKQKQQQLSTTTDASDIFALNLKPTSHSERVGNINRTTTALKSDIIFSESTSNFNDPFDDFNTIVDNNNSSSQLHKFAAAFESDFNAEMLSQPQPPQQQPQQAQQKFTPLAMAAHATALAVLGSNCHFNTNANHTFASDDDEQWDVSQDLTTAMSFDCSNTPAAAKLSNPSAHHQWPGSVDTSNRSATTANANTNFFTTNANKLNSLQHPAAASATTTTASFSLPMPKDSSSSSSAVQSGHSFNKNNNNEDRYAALKDLDEQLRESKAVASAASSIVATAVVDSFAHNNNNNLSSAGTANPFKSQQQQSQQQQQSGAMVNPFQAAHNTQQQNIYGQMTVLPNGIGATNGFGQYSQSPTQQQQHQQQQSQAAAAGFFNYNNGFSTVSGAAAATSMFPTASGPNGCGFGFGAMQQQIAATGGGMGSGMGGAFNNPFAATNSNNPFL